MKKRYLAIPILAIALHFLLSNLLYFLVERLVLDVFHISPQQFMNYSYWGEILIYAVLILVFFTLYKLLWRKEISEPRTATNFKDVLGSLVVGFGICGISGLWIMLAEQLPSLQKSVEAMNAGAENIAGGNAFGTFMIAAVAAPVVEENFIPRHCASLHAEIYPRLGRDSNIICTLRRLSPEYRAGRLCHPYGHCRGNPLREEKKPAVSHPRAFRKQSHYYAAGLCATRSE